MNKLCSLQRFLLCLLFLSGSLFAGCGGQSAPGTARIDKVTPSAAQVARKVTASNNHAMQLLIFRCGKLYESTF